MIAAGRELDRALFRFDADADIGAGHVTRCLALAEVMLGRGWKVIFAVSPQTVETVPLLKSHAKNAVRAIEVAPQHEPRALRDIVGGSCDLLVVDHYGRNAAFERECRGFAGMILVLDDCPLRDHDCDVLVDAAATGSEAYVQRVPHGARVLAGPTYAIIRSAFLERRLASMARRDERPVTEILVSFGATDPLNATSTALDALTAVAGDSRITVALSSKAPHLETIKRRATNKLRVMVDVEDMAELLTEADVAVGAPGASAYERAVLGLPAVQVTLADNQQGIAKLMLQAGAVVDAGVFDRETGGRVADCIKSLMADDGLRIRTARAAAALVDGWGPTRIIEALV